MKAIVVQFQTYLTDFRKNLLQTRYGIPLRNLIFVKSDKKLYFRDNNQAEVCLSEPDWENINGKPVTFPPDSHDHSGMGDMLKSVYDPDDDGIVEQAGAVAWAGVTDKPATFPPDSHNHSGMGDMLKSVYDPDDDGIVEQAEAVAWAGVTGKPATFPPDSHNHSGMGDMLKSVYDPNNDGIVNLAANSTLHNGYTSGQLKATASIIQRTTNQTGIAAGWHVIDFSGGGNGYQYSEMGGWDGATRLGAVRSGWHHFFGQAFIEATQNTVNIALSIRVNGADYVFTHQRWPNSILSASLVVSGFTWLNSSSDYVQLVAYCSSASWKLTAPVRLGLLSFEA